MTRDTPSYAECDRLVTLLETMPFKDARLKAPFRDRRYSLTNWLSALTEGATRKPEYARIAAVIRSGAV